MRALQTASRAERPARAALALVLDGRHGALLTPVDRIGHLHVARQTHKRARAGSLRRARRVVFGAEQSGAEFIERPVGEAVHAERVRVHAHGVLVVVLLDRVQVLLEDLEAVALVLLGQVGLAVRFLELVPQVERKVGVERPREAHRYHKHQQQCVHGLHLVKIEVLVFFVFLN